ncbi:MAG TPA: hypothetical protein VFV50_10960, partial [Bdellovibrionales bacterium]|nr:hypothetical protein [Bdellovibrionales bacterium]
PKNYAGPLSDASHTFKVRALDNAGNVSVDATFTWTVDTGVPAITITGPAVNTPAQTGVTVTGACEDGRTVDISGDVTSPATTACNTGVYSVAVTFTAGEATKNVVVSQTDAAGNTGSANRDFIRDNTIPTVNITGQPSNPSNDTSPDFSFSGADANGVASYECELDGGGYSACTSPKNYAGPLSNASHTFGVRAIDNAGNVSNAASYTWTVDSGAPAITITSPAANTPAQTGVTIAGACEDGLTINISGDVTGPATTTCTTGAYSVAVTFTAGEGTKNVVVAQTDASSNTGSANRDFIRDNTIPTVNITANPTNPSNDTSPDFSFSGADNVAVASYECELDGGGFSACTSPKNYAGPLSNASHTFKVRALDGAGNVSNDAAYTWTVDAAAPNLTIASPAANTPAQTGVTVTGACEDGLTINISGDVTGPATATCSSSSYSVAVTFTAGEGTKNIVLAQTDGASNTTSVNRDFIRDNTIPTVNITANPANPSNDTSPTFSFSGADGNGVASYACELDGGGFVTCASPKTFAGPLADGPHEFKVRSIDNAGNVSNEAAYSWTIDTGAPGINITSPAANTPGQTGITVGGSCETGLTVAISGDVTGPATTSCPAGTFSVAVTFSAGEGNKTVTVSQTDASSNTATDSRVFVRDNTIPTVNITANPTNPSNNVSPSFSFSGADNVAVASYECELDAGGFSACTSPKSYTGPLSNASHTFKVRALDTAGNVSNDATYTWTVDAAAPNLTIASPAANTPAQTGVTVTGACEDGLTINISGDVTGPATATCSSSSYSVAVTFTAGEGT